MPVNPAAEELNETIRAASPATYDSLSQIGKKAFFPKGIISQSAEAKQKATLYDATLGIAWEHGEPITLRNSEKFFPSLFKKEVYPYAPTEGKADLRKLWQREIFRKNPSLAGKRISLPIVTNGITHSIQVAASMFCDPGDVVLVPDLFWGNYRLLLNTLMDVEMRFFTLFDERLEGFDVADFAERLKALAQERGKVVVILNFPNNPTGYTPTRAEYEKIGKALRETAEGGTRVVAMYDDAYFGLNFDDGCEESAFAMNLGTHSNLIGVKLDGATKECFAWGFRCGFLTLGIDSDRQDELYATLEKKIGGYVRASVSNCCHPVQSILVKVLESEDYERDVLRNFEIMKGRALKTKEILRDGKYRKHFVPYPFNSGYFMCVKLHSLPAEALRLRLLDAYGIGTVSINEDSLRIGYCAVDEENLPDLFEKLFLACEDLDS